MEQGLEATIFADREGIIRLRAAHWQGYHRAIAAGRIQSDGKPMLTRAAHKDGSKIYVELAFGIVSGIRRACYGKKIFEAVVLPYPSFGRIELADHKNRDPGVRQHALGLAAEEESL